MVVLLVAPGVAWAQELTEADLGPSLVWRLVRVGHVPTYDLIYLTPFEKIDISPMPHGGMPNVSIIFFGDTTNCAPITEIVDQNGAVAKIPKLRNCDTFSPPASVYFSTTKNIDTGKFFLNLEKMTLIHGENEEPISTDGFHAGILSFFEKNKNL
ncbi:hypothetical protein [Acetobacter persici]|uniref:hypothetical protein n=1 Tax=Acetobacter persici TaxID=1076596 RepID=UPI0012FDCB9A|nr:hypothetical protein [Acetobacter persici]